MSPRIKGLQDAHSKMAGTKTSRLCSKEVTMHVGCVVQSQVEQHISPRTLRCTSTAYIMGPTSKPTCCAAC